MCVFGRDNRRNAKKSYANVGQFMGSSTHLFAFF